jgi:N-acetylneuraminic acid mutarotase
MIGTSIVLTGGDTGIIQSDGGDVFVSNDAGSTWTTVTTNAAWSARTGHTLQLVGATLILMGGVDVSSTSAMRNDVYSGESSGSSWVLVTGNALWTPRYGHGSVTVGTSIVLMGGLAAKGSSTPVFCNDVYVSDDKGSSWRVASSTAPWAARMNFGVTVTAEGGIIVAGGRTRLDLSIWNPTNDVYISSDKGSTWSLVISTAPWVGRGGLNLLSVGASLIVFGGRDPAISNLRDVWRGSKGCPSGTAANPKSECRPQESADKGIMSTWTTMAEEAWGASINGAIGKYCIVII